MVALKLASLALAFSHLVSAQKVQLPEGVTLESMEEIVTDESKQQSSPLAVEIQASFPDAELFGVKLVNGHPTRALLSVTNKESAPITLLILGGTLTTPLEGPNAPSPPQVVRNLTTTNYGLNVPAGASESVTYSFATELHPQELQLNLAAVLRRGEAEIFTQVVYNGTVEVVEAPMSIFDPQIIFLYLTLAAAFAGTCYFIYTTWITTLFPQKRRAGKGGERAKRSSAGTKKVDPSEQVSVVGADGPAVTTSAKAYDESWIPEGHLQRPTAKRVGSGRPKSRAA